MVDKNMNNRIRYSDKKEWEEFRYRPSPIITRTNDYNALQHWQEQIPDCTIETIEEDFGFMGHFDVKIKIIPPDNYFEMYVDPLVEFHKQWSEIPSNLIYTMYPFPINGRNKKKFYIGGKISSIIYRIYWDMDYKKYNPDTWVDMLNNILEYVEGNPLKDSEKWTLKNFEDGLKEKIHYNIMKWEDK